MASTVSRIRSGLQTVSSGAVRRRMDDWIGALAPSWLATRADARLRAAQSQYLAAAYETSAGKLQRSPRNITALSENGQLLNGSLTDMVEWSRDTFRRSSIMSGFMRRALDNMVGTGLQLIPMTDDKVFNEEFKAWFYAHTRRKGGWELTGRWTIEEGQRLALLSCFRDGNLLWYKSDHGWQAFESIQMGTPTNYSNKDRVVQQGVELDELQRPAYYWVSDYAKWGYVDGSTAKGLNADFCLLMGIQEWASGNRSLPIYHNCLQRFEDVDRYLEAELIKNMAQSCVIGEIQSPHNNALEALSIAKPGDSTAAERERVKSIKVAPGFVAHTRPGEVFKLHNAQGLSASFADYLRGNLRILGFPIGMPLEMALMDFTETNFAAAKMALSQSQRTQAYWVHNVLMGQMMEPMYFDAIDNRPKALKTSAEIKNLYRYEVIAPEAPWIEPYREAMALNEGLKGGWDSMTRIAREEMRRTVDSIFNDRADEINKAKAIAQAKGIADQWEMIWRGISAEKADSAASIPGDGGA